MNRTMFWNMPVMLSLAFFSCGQRANSSVEQYADTVAALEMVEKDSGESADIPHVGIEIEIEKISSAEFKSARKFVKESSAVEKITNFKTVQKMLAGTVDFQEMDGYLVVTNINFRNGTSSPDKELLSECSFVAYFPADDILLLEGGHTTDISFDLSTGEDTYDSGNPSLVTISPSAKYRLNKVFEGQECFDHFIQEHSDGKFKKIAGLNAIFEKKYSKWLCVVEKEYWTDDYTLYFGLVTEYNEAGNAYEYYKVKIGRG